MPFGYIATTRVIQDNVPHKYENEEFGGGLCLADVVRYEIRVVPIRRSKWSGIHSITDVSHWIRNRPVLGLTLSSSYCTVTTVTMIYWQENALHFSENSLSTGVRLVVSSPGFYPLMNEGITVSPGTETRITLTQTNRSFLGKPYTEVYESTFTRSRWQGWHLHLQR